MVSTDEILNKYGARIEKEMRGSSQTPQTQQRFSKSYERFKESMSPSFSRFERFCKSLGNIFRVKVAEKDRRRIERDISIAHLDLSPEEVAGFSVSVALLNFVIGFLICISIWLLKGVFSFSLVMFLVLFFGSCIIASRLLTIPQPS